jgi:hypothetical protein
MKQAENNEMDLILRALGRRATGGLSARRGDEGGGFTEHLDADELNAFAEGMVPDRARTRYTQHIADCENCRSIVITLTQAAAPTVQPPAVTENVGTGFLHKVAAWFSPPVLRYAVPAVALAAVIGISLLALREQRSSDFVAQHQPSSPAISGEPNQAATPSAYSSAEAPDAAQKSLQSATNEEGLEKKNLPGDRSALDQTPETKAAKTVADLQAAKDSAQPGTSSTGASQPSFAPEPNAPAAPPPQPAPSEADKLAILSKEESAQPQAAQRRQREDYKVQARDEAESNRAAAPTAGASSPSPGRVQGLMTENRGYASKNKRDSVDDSETRSVSGRQFRRQRNAWVDTAYDSSRATINVRRGSEQYRALIADEPAIRTIVEQLGGEIVLVWKGRAYRIR